MLNRAIRATQAPGHSPNSGKPDYMYRLLMSVFTLKNQSLFTRTIVLMATVALTACSSLEPARLELNDLSSLKPSHTTYEAVMSRYGQPQHEEESGGEIRVTYAVDQEASSLSNIDGKGFVRGVGGFVNTYRTGSRNVTLVFDATTRLYKKLQWQSTNTLQAPRTSPP